MKNKIISLLLLSLMSLGVKSAEYKVIINDLSYKDSVQIQTKPELVTCESPEVLNNVSNICYNPFDSVQWVLRGQDSCNGVNQANFNPNIYYVRTNNTNKNYSLPIPEGFHWVTSSEYRILFDNREAVNKHDQSIDIYIVQSVI